jgi:tRNA/tmRNA/rRNA uracil-C5-methylase (TrmA/RlmC/RlmD family)
VITGTTPGEAVVSVTPRGQGAPRLPGVAAGLVVRGKVRRDPGAVHMDVRGQTYRVSSGVFWQAHVGAAEALLGAVLECIGDCNGAAVADLYAGAGLFSVALAHAVGPDGSVLAVERDRRACADARHNAAGLPQLSVDEAEVTPELVATGIGRPSVMVLDPAREGAGIDVMHALASHTSALRKLVYVSCDAATFARDLRVVVDQGWTLSSLRAFDIFPMTEHVELVAMLEPSATRSRDVTAGQLGAH